MLWISAHPLNLTGYHTLSELGLLLDAPLLASQNILYASGGIGMKLGPFGSPIWMLGFDVAIIIYIVLVTFFDQNL